MLQELGLTALQEEVYRALLADPAHDSTSLARLLGRPEAVIAATSAELTELSILRMSRQDPDRLHPVPLERCVAVLHRRQEEELARRRRALLDGRAAAAALAESATRERFHDPADVVRVTTIDDIQNTLESLLHGATTEIWSMVPNVMSREALEASRYIDEELLRNHIKIKSLCNDRIRSSPFALAYEYDILAKGAQVRTAPALPMRLLVIDRTYALLPFDTEAVSEGAIVTTAPGIVTALSELFIRCWDAATPLEDAQPHADDAPLNDTEAELLRLLSAGITDEVAARRLRVSVRTVKRRMEDLMHRLEANSRFEAGVRAAQRGWL